MLVQHSMNQFKFIGLEINGLTKVGDERNNNGFHPIVFENNYRSNNSGYYSLPK